MENVTVTLQEIVDKVNNVNLDNEIVLFSRRDMSRSVSAFPVKFDALIIILCTEGGGEISIDLKKYVVERNSVVVLQPHNYLLSFESAPDSEYKVIACSKRILEVVAPKLSNILPLLVNRRLTPVYKHSSEFMASIEEYYAFLQRKIEVRSSVFRKEIVSSILQAMIYEMLGKLHDLDEKYQKTRREEIMAQFMIAVGENLREHRDVSFYAQKVFVSPKHLSSVVKQLTGITAGEFIGRFVAMEAKILLRNTDLSIQEISERLNFLTQSHFGKYFRKVTGITPTQYRKENS